MAADKVFSDASGIVFDRDALEHGSALDDATAAVEDRCGTAAISLAKAKGVLQRFYKEILPKDAALEDVDALADALSEDSPVAYERKKKGIGTSMGLAMAMASEAELDLPHVTSQMPTAPDGSKGPLGGVPVDTSTVPQPRPSLDDASQLVFLRDRVRRLENEILGVQGHADVWKSKAERATAREEYLMVELRQLSEQLQCVNLVPREEKERVAVWINCLTQHDLEAGGFFWMDRDRATVLATMQDRVHQVSRVVKQAKTSMASILYVMFLLDEAHSTLWDLLSKFRDAGHVKELVRHQLVAGLKVALSLVRVHRPDVNLAAGETRPPL